MSATPGTSHQMMLEIEEERKAKEERRRKQFEEESQREQDVSDDDDNESDEDEDDESSHSDLQINSEESQGELSIFNYEQDSDSSESLLDLDDNDFNNMNETKIALHEMMDTCYELDDKQGFKANEDKILRQQVQQSAAVFEKQFMPDSRLLERNKTMWQRQKRKSLIGDSESMGSTPSTKNADSLQENSSRRSSTKKQLSQTVEEAAKMTTQAVKPSDMFLAYKHTNMCAHLLRKRTDEMGLEETLISLDDYEEGLKQMTLNDDVETDSTDVAELKMYQLVSGHWKVASNLPNLVGAFDYKEYLAKEDIVVEKPEKKIVKRRARNFDPDSLIATQVEVGITKEASAAKSKANDQVVKKFRQNLVDFTGGKGSASLYEFTVNKDSMRESLNNMFGVAFGVRDGTISLNQEGKHLKITPEAPLEEDIHNMSKRRQCIVSISAASMRKLQEIAKGENAIQSNE